MFVDTLGFEFHYSTLDKCERILSQLELVQATYKKYKSGEKLYRSFKLFPEGVKTDLKSYSEDINVQLRRKKGVKLDFYSLYFEFSIPKFYYQTNCFSFDCDFIKFFKDFKEYLKTQSLVNIDPDFTTISRLDCTASFLFSSRDEMQECLDFFTPPRIQQRRNGTQRFDTTLNFSSSYHCYKLYQKFDEMKDNKKRHKLTEEKFQDYFLKSENILRFEHTLKSAQLKRLMGLKQTDLITLDKFLESDFYNSYDIMQDIKNVFGDWEKEYKCNSLEEALELIDFSFSRKYKKYFQFISKVFVIGLDATKKSMKQQTYSYYKCELKKIGIDIEKLAFFVENKRTLSFKDTHYFTKERIISFDKN